MPSRGPSTPLRTGLVPSFKGFSHLAAFLILVQAVLAGLFTSGEELDARDWHEIVGNTLFVVVTGQLVFAYLVRGWSRFNLWLWVLALWALIVAQTGLGYLGRDDTLPAAVHVPLGVFIFGFATLISALAFFEDRLPEREGRKDERREQTG